ncbi:MAG: AAA family ATPase [Deltaproteobacteria bacterium]|nr:AAA family ATPase [Deltaproteobacteria bacterium]
MRADSRVSWVASESGRISRTDLDAALAKLEHGRGGLVGLEGEAGVGKSRLCFEFTESCRNRGILVRHARSVAHGRMIPFLPIYELLRGIFGVSEGDDDNEARRKIAGSVLLLEPELTDRLPLLFEFLGVGDGEAPDPQLDPEARRRRLIAVVMRLLRARGRREPAVYVFEDLHWIDPGSEAFLDAIAEIAEETRTLVLVNFRPGYRATWMQHSSYTALPLAPLGDDAVEELLDEQLGCDTSTVGLRRAIRVRAAGIPFFVEEVVYSLLEAGVLERVGDACVKVRSVKHFEVPDTVNAVVAARIDRLDEEEKRVLQTAAVIGRRFSERVLGPVLGLPTERLHNVLRDLTKLGFVYQESQYPLAEYSFKHPLTQEVAYGSQLSGRRASIHAAVARELEQLQPDHLNANAALLAYHEEGAGRLLEAARWHGRAAEWVGIRDVEAAHRHWRATISLAERTPESAERDELLLKAHFWMLQLAWRLGLSKEETYGIFLRGAGLAEYRGERMALGMLALGYAIYRGVIGDEDGEHRYASEAAALADEVGNLFVSLMARVVMATALHFQGRLREAIEVADSAVAHHSGASADNRVWISPYSYILGLRGALHSLCGSFVDASADLDRALAQATKSGDSESLACVHGFAAQHAVSTGEFLNAVEHAQQMSHAAQRTGIPLLLVDSYISLGSALLLSARWDESVEVLEQALEIANSRGVLLGPKRRILAALAEAYLGRNENERARHIAEELLAAPHSGALLVEISAGLVLARALLRLEGGKARDAVHTAITRAQLRIEQSGARSLAPQIHRVLAEVAELDGDHTTRVRELREAHRLYQEMSAAGHANRIARLIAQPASAI